MARWFNYIYHRNPSVAQWNSNPEM